MSINYRAATPPHFLVVVERGHATVCAPIANSISWSPFSNGWHTLYFQETTGHVHSVVTHFAKGGLLVMGGISGDINDCWYSNVNKVSWKIL